ncbi:glycosyltransferase family 1 protein [Pontibacter sp. SGAir0037]|uniref:glycosyltransferase family 4 protein n=1 Tax=Pontibacter sp. SGAir0037 TaxID=2571030 RepID=UPI00143CD6DE|nr:glycosyltransferase family 1 protein [Pontibacter sp. SGAir0037]
MALIKNCFYAARRQGDINHITGDVNYIALVLDGKKTVLTIHDIESLAGSNWLKNLLLSLFWLKLPVKRAAFITVVSHHSKKKLIQATGVSESKVVVIPNCIQIPEAAYKPKETINKQEPVLLQVGTKSNKNLSMLVEAVTGLSCKILILGKLTEDQVNLLNRQGIRYENYFNLKYQEVLELYYKADILTFVSTYEGFGMPILEANALGIPVITSNTASMPEVAGEGALFVNPYKASEIRAAIEKLIEDDQLRASLVKAGKVNVARFSPEKIASQYEALYARVTETAK